MTPTINALWVEDETKDRKADKERLEKKTKNNLKITLIHPTKMEEAFDLHDWDLFLVDYYLNLRSLHDNDSRSADDSHYKYRGLTADSIIREKYPDIPIYGMSNRYDELKSGPESFSIHNSFERFLSLAKIQKYGENYLYFDALDYRFLREAENKNVDTLFNLIKAPEEIRDRLRLTFPEYFRNGLNTTPEGNSLAFAKWVNDIFFKVPGFLYDGLNASTFLGIDGTIFEKIKKESSLDNALYKGVFSKSHSPHWWKSKLFEIIYNYPEFEEERNKSPSVIGPKIFSIPKKHQTKCIVCHKEYPEIVGYNITDPTDRAPVHFKCSKPYPKFKGELYFDEYRGFTTNPE